MESVIFLISSLVVVTAVDNRCSAILWQDTACPITIHTTLSLIPGVDNIVTCQSHCVDLPVCSHYTLFTPLQSQVSSCALLRSCNTNETISCTPQPDTVISNCVSAISGPRSPPVKDVCCKDLANKVCHGNIISQDYNVKNPEDCQKLCVETEGCTFFTQYSVDWCTLFETCSKLEHCTLCTSGPVNPSLDTCNKHPALATLLLGGETSTQGMYSTNMELITATSSCIPDIPEVPLGLRHPTAVILGSTLLYCGGHARVTPQVRPDCHTYNLGKEGARWEVGPTMNYPRSHFSLVTYHGQVFAVGGYCIDIPPTETGATVEVLTPGQGWTISKTMSMPSYRYHHCSVILNHKLIVVGGYVSGSSYSTSVIEFDLKIRNGWKHLPSTHYGRQYHSCQVGKFMQQEGIFVAGGSNSGHNLVEFFVQKINRWRKLPALTKNRYYHTSSIINGRVYLHGGDPTATRSTQEHFVEVWTQHSNLLDSRAYHAGVMVPSDMVKCKK